MNRRIGFVLVVALVGLALMAGALRPVAAQEGPVRVIFMHHSTGGGLIWQGGLREAFTDLGYEFWDHGYNDEGLTDAAGESTGENWDVPGDNTDPSGWHEIFAQPVTVPPENTFSHMLEFDVIIFKSCFPNADIQSDEQLEEYRSYFLDIRDVIDQHPDKIFVAFTIPPLTPGSTSPEAAARARQWSEYLTSDEFLAGHPNLFVFNFYDLLAGEDNYLRAEYRSADPGDDHPNELANQTIAPILADFVDQIVQGFVPGEPSVQPVIHPVAQPEPPEVVASDLLDDFEAGDLMDRWWTYINNDQTTVFECAPGGPGYDSDQALQITFEAGGWETAGCGSDLQSGESWANTVGVSFYWQADQPGLAVIVAMLAIDPADPDQNQTPFETMMFTPDRVGEWQQVVVLWDGLVKPDWFGDAGLAQFDPSLVSGIVFTVGSVEGRQSGTILIDDLRLVTAE